jgi:hypothetical protein
MADLVTCIFKISCEFIYPWIFKTFCKFKYLPVILVTVTVMIMQRTHEFKLCYIHAAVKLYFHTFPGHEIASSFELLFDHKVLTHTHTHTHTHISLCSVSSLVFTGQWKNKARLASVLNCCPVAKWGKGTARTEWLLATPNIDPDADDQDYSQSLKWWISGQ